MSALAKAVLAFAQRYSMDECARPRLAAVGESEHHATCLCAACRARREATASHLPVQPNNLPSSGPREPERAPEGVADGAAAASTRSQAAASASQSGELRCTRFHGHAGPCARLDWTNRPSHSDCGLPLALSGGGSR